MENFLKNRPEKDPFESHLGFVGGRGLWCVCGGAHKQILGKDEEVTGCW